MSRERAKYRLCHLINKLYIACSPKKFWNDADKYTLIVLKKFGSVFPRTCYLRRKSFTWFYSYNLTERVIYFFMGRFNRDMGDWSKTVKVYIYLRYISFWFNTRGMSLCDPPPTQTHPPSPTKCLREIFFSTMWTLRGSLFQKISYLFKFCKY